MNPSEQIRAFIDNICQAFIGKEQVVTEAVLTLIAGGHVLLEDVPGLGKTLLAKAIARSLEADFKRIQFTADLLPSDVTGVTVFSPDRREFNFRQGPIFTNVLLGDEINRATPRTQSSLLEAMEEQNVTVDGVLYPLPEPFFVMATQNPVELEGTYPLPFAQMDRFMLRLSIGYLDREFEMKMLKLQQRGDPLDRVRPLLSCGALLQLRSEAQRVSLADAVLGYLVDLVRATRDCHGFAYGASPRAALDLQAFSRGIALLEGRDYVLPDDVKRGARLALPHRLIGKPGAASLDARAMIDKVVDSVPVPV